MGVNRVIHHRDDSISACSLHHQGDMAEEAMQRLATAVLHDFKLAGTFDAFRAEAIEALNSEVLSCC